jgi:hypothetical protein
MTLLVDSEVAAKAARHAGRNRRFVPRLTMDFIAKNVGFFGLLALAMPILCGFLAHDSPPEGSHGPFSGVLRAVLDLPERRI